MLDFHSSIPPFPFPRLRDDSDGTAYDQHSSSIIRLNNGTILYLREVNRFLALVCLLREDVFERQGLIEYNCHGFREAIQEVCPTHSLTIPISFVCVCAGIRHSTESHSGPQLLGYSKGIPLAVN